MNTTKDAFAFLKGGGEMGSLIRSRDWSTTLGTPDTWPQSLKTAVSIILHSRFPMFIWWGRDLITIYNDAYITIAGDKHPQLLGQPGNIGWSEVWTDIGPLVKDVQAGNATWSEDQLLHINRSGYVEDSYFTFSHSPINDEYGTVLGVFCACIETTDKVKAVQRIQGSETTLRSMIVQAPVAVCILKGPEHIVEIANDRMYELWGKGADIMLGKPIFDGLTEARHQGLEELLDGVYRTGETFHASEHRVQLPRNGKLDTLFIDFVYEPLRENNGRVTGIIAVAIDSTEKVLARQKIEKSEQQVRALIAAAPYPIAQYTGREMRIEFANKAIIDVWGKGDDVVGKIYNELLPELNNSEIFKQVRAVFNTGRPFHARNERVDLVVDGVMRTYYFNYSFTPLFDANGNVYAVLNTGADVTDLNLAKQKIEQSEANIRNIILKAPVAMCMLLGPDHIVDIANDEMITLWGKPALQVMHKPIFEALPDAKGQGLEELIAKAYNTGEPYHGNEQPVELLRNGKMEIVYQNFVYEPFKNAEGEIIGVLAISIDVTPQVTARQKIEEIVEQRTRQLADTNDALQRLNAELKRSNSNLAEFAYAASHDLKEPIRKIHLFSERLKDSLHDRMTPGEKKDFERIELASKRMGNLIDDLLTYSEVDYANNRKETVDLNAVLEQVLADLDLEIEQKGASVEVDKLPVLQGHRRQWQQAFHNLVGNALKYSKRDTSPQIEICADIVYGESFGERLAAEDRLRRYHRIRIKDNGIGFDPVDADRIFNVFTRLEYNNGSKGTGIGLSIVRKVVVNHQGAIWAEGRPNEGSTFHILVPES